MAIARFPDYVVQPVRHLAGGAREDRELDLLDRHRRSAGVSLLHARAAGHRTAVRGVHGTGAVGLHRLAPPAPRAGGAPMISAELLRQVPGCEDGEPPYSQ